MMTVTILFHGSCRPESENSSLWKDFDAFFVRVIRVIRIDFARFLAKGSGESAESV
jgi:hypothetical protein